VTKYWSQLECQWPPTELQSYGKCPGPKRDIRSLQSNWSPQSEPPALIQSSSLRLFGCPKAVGEIRSPTRPRTVPNQFSAYEQLQTYPLRYVNVQSTFGGSLRKMRRENPGLFSPGVPEPSLVLGSRQYGGVSGDRVPCSQRTNGSNISVGGWGCHPVRLTTRR
jgi:hypothetical protein